MKILFCCELYFPSIGGVQVVMQQLAERFAARGHDVTVATTMLKERLSKTINSVKVAEFSVTGNNASGLHGDIDQYRDFVTSGNFDVVMIKAAQQWTFDALWPVIDKINGAKVFIPCGFSGLYEPAYEAYFNELPAILHKLDHLIFYASDYRDINFAIKNLIDHYSIIPNGASELEFEVPLDDEFRKRYEIGENELLFLTVGSMTGLKGHLEVAKAFEYLRLTGQHATLILNGNRGMSHNGIISRLVVMYGLYGLKYVFKNIVKFILQLAGINVGKEDELDCAVRRINSKSDRQVIVVDLPRIDLVQAFIASDLFIFASNVEYSPLVLFESVAAGTPFLSVPVGNSEEIASWTGAGVICPAPKDSKGYTRVDPKELAIAIEGLISNPEQLKTMGKIGKENWRQNFTWEKIADMYEAVFVKCLEKQW